ncbi:MAG TPA: FtsX-like permease family protein [Firmicutes bacterium]|nr:FtsX-like permease family protein [Bacillota bacterium]
MIYRIPARIIRRQLGQFIGVITIVAIASFSHSLLTIGVNALEEGYAAFASDYKQETAHFITVHGAPEAKLERKYKVEIEERQVLEVEWEDKALRVFTPTQHVNLACALAGKSVPSRGEILLDPLFAKANGYALGDSFRIGNRTYKVAGFIYMPDYIYITRYDQDIINNPLEFGIGLMDKRDMVWHSTEPYRYYVIGGPLSDVRGFKEDLEACGLVSFVEKKENPRITTTEMKLAGTKAVITPITLMMTLISSFLTFTVLGRLINSLRVEIGTLMALGYRRGEIARTFLYIPLFIWIVGASLGTAMGFLLTKPFVQLYVEYFNIPLVAPVFPTRQLLEAFFLPGIFIFSGSLFALRELFAKEPLALLRGSEGNSGSSAAYFLQLDGLSFPKRVMLRHGLSRMWRNLVLVVGVACSTFLLIYGFTAERTLQGMVNQTFSSTFNYDYMYVLSSNQRGKKFPSAEGFNLRTLYDSNGRNVVLYGIQKGSNMVSLRNLDGLAPDLSGIALAKPLAAKLKAAKGDVIELNDKLNDKPIRFRVSDVVELRIGNYAFIDLEEFNRVFELPRGSYRGLFSPTELRIDESLVFMRQDKAYIASTFENMMAPVKQSLAVISAISLMLALSIANVLSTLSLNENRRTIGILKIFGFRDGEIVFMTLGFERICFYIGMLLGIPLFNRLVNLLMASVAEQSDFALEFEADPVGILWAFGVLAVLYHVVQRLLRNRVYRMSGAELLKERTD